MSVVGDTDAVPVDRLLERAIAELHGIDALLAQFDDEHRARGHPALELAKIREARGGLTAQIGQLRGARSALTEISGRIRQTTRRPPG